MHGCCVPHSIPTREECSLVPLATSPLLVLDKLNPLLELPQVINQLTISTVISQIANFVPNLSPYDIIYCIPPQALQFASFVEQQFTKSLLALG